MGANKEMLQTLENENIWYVDKLYVFLFNFNKYLTNINIYI
jgi:hypothetical protein